MRMTSFNISNRTLGIVAGAVVIGAILHVEYRVSILAEKVDAITSIIINTNEPIKYTPAERDCLTRNIYYEARGEQVEGQYAVANVTVNRLKSGKWGNNICSVVYAKKQFSWTHQKKLSKPDVVGWAQAQEIAVNTLNGTRVRGLDQSLFYHADYIKSPGWVDNRHYVTQIGQHKFYNLARIQEKI
jgi:spore germination cell wall hydrolase CwlJ-like protein